MTRPFHHKELKEHKKEESVRDTTRPAAEITRFWWACPVFLLDGQSSIFIFLDIFGFFEIFVVK